MQADDAQNVVPRSYYISNLTNLALELQYNYQNSSKELKFSLGERKFDINMNHPNVHRLYMMAAYYLVTYKEKSNKPGHRIGAILVSEKGNILSAGINTNKIDENQYNKMSQEWRGKYFHAERNAIHAYLLRYSESPDHEDIAPKIDIKNCYLYTTLEPCDECRKYISEVFAGTNLTVIYNQEDRGIRTRSFPQTVRIRQVNLGAPVNFKPIRYKPSDSDMKEFLNTSLLKNVPYANAAQTEYEKKTWQSLSKHTDFSELSKKNLSIKTNLGHELTEKSEEFKKRSKFRDKDGRASKDGCNNISSFINYSTISQYFREKIAQSYLKKIQKYQRFEKKMGAYSSHVNISEESDEDVKKYYIRYFCIEKINILLRLIKTQELTDESIFSYRRGYTIIDRNDHSYYRPKNEKGEDEEEANEGEGEGEGTEEEEDRRSWALNEADLNEIPDSTTATTTTTTTTQTKFNPTNVPKDKGKERLGLKRSHPGVSISPSSRFTFPPHKKARCDNTDTSGIDLSKEEDVIDLSKEEDVIDLSKEEEECYEEKNKKNPQRMPYQSATKTTVSPVRSQRVSTSAHGASGTGSVPRPSGSRRQHSNPHQQTVRGNRSRAATRGLGESTDNSRQTKINEFFRGN